MKKVIGNLKRFFEINGSLKLALNIFQNIPTETIKDTYNEFISK